MLGHNMKSKFTFFVLLFISNVTFATNVHFSPEIKTGPYYTSGASGGGLQIGVSDKSGLDALYLSYTHTSAEFITDKDRLKTYRLGVQYQLVTKPKIAVQFEGGVVDYEGSRRNIFDDERRYLSGLGVSSAAALVIFINKNIGLRAGLDLNYIDTNDTFLSYPFSATYSAGLVLHF